MQRAKVVGVAGQSGELAGRQPEPPPTADDLKINLLAGRIALELLDGQAIGGSIRYLLGDQCSGQLLVIEGRVLAALLGLDNEELMALRSRADLVPELAVVIEPMRFDAVAEDFVADQFRQPSRPGIIGLRALGKSGSGKKGP